MLHAPSKNLTERSVNMDDKDTNYVPANVFKYFITIKRLD